MCVFKLPGCQAAGSLPDLVLVLAPLGSAACLLSVWGLKKIPFGVPKLAPRADLKNSIVEQLLLCGNRPCCVEFLVARLGLSIWWRAGRDRPDLRQSWCWAAGFE